MLFTKEDYASSNGFLTSCFGPPIWTSLHMISFNYSMTPTDEDKDNYYNYVMSLTHVLPCKACRDNLKINLQKMKFDKSKLKNRETFSRFIYDLHNIVNQNLGKPKYLTYESVRDQYEMFRASCSNGVPNKLMHQPGCVTPVNKIKTQCILHMVPYNENQSSMIIDNKCYAKKKKTSKKSSKKKSKKSSKKR